MKKNRVAVIGVGSTSKPGLERPEQSWREMIVEGAYKALADAGITAKQVDGVCMSYVGEGCSETGGIAANISDALGMKMIPVMATASNCTGAGVAMYTAFNMIQSGDCDIVLVGGFDKLSDSYNYIESINISFNVEYDYEFGFSHYDGFTLQSNEYFRVNGYSDEEERRALASFAHQMHKNARGNRDAAHYGRPLPSVEDFMNAYACGTNMTGGEGAAFVVMCSEQTARKVCDRPVFMDGIAFVCNSHYIPHNYLRVYDKAPERVGLSVYQGAMKASEEAYAMAGITPEDVDVFAAYDLLSSSFWALEGAGICPIGEAGRWAIEGKFDIDGTIPVNTHGGNIAFGHVSGADSTYQVGELVHQLRGDAQNQVKDPKVAVDLNTGGCSALTTCIVLRNE